MPVIRAEGLEMTSRGAALASGLTAQFWNSFQELSSLSISNSQFLPQMKKPKREELLYSWKQALQRAKGWEG